MNHTAAADFITANKGTEIEIELVDGDILIGDALSVNSKGVNIKIDGKTKSVSLSRINDLVLPAGDDAEDTDSDEAMTTAELAAHLSDDLNLVDFTPKALRVHLRALGLGVGKGRKYSLSATEYRMVRNLVKADA